jgi:hypothetical protein
METTIESLMIPATIDERIRVAAAARRAAAVRRAREPRRLRLRMRLVPLARRAPQQ